MLAMLQAVVRNHLPWLITGSSGAVTTVTAAIDGSLPSALVGLVGMGVGAAVFIYQQLSRAKVQEDSAAQLEAIKNAAEQRRLELEYYRHQVELLELRASRAEAESERWKIRYQISAGIKIPNGPDSPPPSPPPRESS